MSDEATAGDALAGRGRVEVLRGNGIWTCVDAAADGDRASRCIVSSGFRGVDRLLPAGGIGRGSLIEWIGGESSGATALACAVACRLLASFPSADRGRAAAAARMGGTILVVDRRGRFHPPAVLPWLEWPSLERRPDRGSAATARAQAGRRGAGGPLVVVRPSRDEDEIWAIDQALRCPGVAAVLAWPERVSNTAMRRWQLASRTGGTVGLLVRPPRAGREPTWAEARLGVVAMAHGGAEPWRGDRHAAGHDGVRMVGSLAVRRLRLSLIEGPWACESPPDGRALEIAIDMATGREALGREGLGRDVTGRATSGRDSSDRERAAVDRGTHSQIIRGLTLASGGTEGVSCRAS